MTSSRVLPRRSYHLRVFAASLALVVLCLSGFLFGVSMEAVAPATGIITARDLREMRTLQGGLVEPGWHEGEISQPTGEVLHTRLDAQGDGVTDPAAGKSQPIRHYQLEDGRRLREDGLHFHRLQAGDELWPGQVLAAIRADDMRLRLRHLENQEDDSSATDRTRLRLEQMRLRQQLEQAMLRVPAGSDPWLTLEVRAAPLQAVQAGDVIAVIVPIDPQTRQPRDLIARLDVPEKHFGDLRPRQLVRLYSAMHHQHLDGGAEAQIERLEPWGKPAADGERHFHALAPITRAPDFLPLGSSFKAEIVVGRKTVYRIILDH